MVLCAYSKLTILIALLVIDIPAVAFDALVDVTMGSRIVHFIKQHWLRTC